MLQWYSMRLVYIAGYCLNVSFKYINVAYHALSRMYCGDIVFKSMCIGVPNRCHQQRNTYNTLYIEVTPPISHYGLSTLQYTHSVRRHTNEEVALVNSALPNNSHSRRAISVAPVSRVVVCVAGFACLSCTRS